MSDLRIIGHILTIILRQASVEMHQQRSTLSGFDPNYEMMTLCT